MKAGSTLESANAAPSASRVTIDDLRPGEVIIGVGTTPPSNPIVVAIVYLIFAVMVFFMLAKGMGDWLAATIAGTITAAGLLAESLTVWREEYRLDVAASRLSIVRRSRFRQAQSIVTLNDANEVRVIRYAMDGDDYRVLIMAAARRVQLRLPAKVTLTNAKDARRIGLVLAEALGVPLRDKSQPYW